MTAIVDGTNGLLQQYDYQTPTTGFSYTFAAGTTNLVMNPAGTLATGTVTMPASPADGMTITISSSQQITAITIQGNTGQSISGQPTIIYAGGGVTFVYRLASTTWFAYQDSALQTTNIPVMRVYTTPGTWTKSDGLKAIKVTVIGGGSGGSGSSPGAFNNSGAGGGTAIKTYPAPSLPGPQPYTIGAAGTAGGGTGGAGGTTSFGVAPAVVISATGGAATITSAGAAAAGGSGTNGDVNLPGLSGLPAGARSAGGLSALYSAGQGGASGIAPATSGLAGAAGTIIVEEFY